MTTTRIPCRLLWIALAALPPTAQAQGLPDPTRPPAALEAPSAVGEAGQGAATGLQTIIRREGRKPAAVINGEYVELGGKAGDAKLVKVGEDSVVLQGPGGKEELKLFPGVEKKMAVAAPPRQAKAAKGAKRAPAKDKGEAKK